MIENSFQPPQQWLNSNFELKVLSPKYAIQDYEAVTASASKIRYVFGPSNDWPSETITFEENLNDLKRHEKEFTDRAAFAYAIFDLSGIEYLGCIYINPFHSKIYNNLKELKCQAEVFFWVSSLQTSINEFELLETLKKWLSTSWPFEQVNFPGREANSS
jgi:hypothetical protein